MRRLLALLNRSPLQPHSCDGPGKSGAEQGGRVGGQSDLGCVRTAARAGAPFKRCCKKTAIRSPKRRLPHVHILLARPRRVAPRCAWLPTQLPRPSAFQKAQRMQLTDGVGGAGGAAGPLGSGVAALGVGGPDAPIGSCRHARRSRGRRARGGGARGQRRSGQLRARILAACVIWSKRPAAAACPGSAGRSCRCAHHATRTGRGQQLPQS